MKPAMTEQQAHFSDSSQSGLRLYRELVTGQSSLLHFLGYEISTTLLSNLPGLLGLGARAYIYPLLFGSAGRRPAIGKGVSIRRPLQINLGNKVLLDDYAVLDVRGAEGSLNIGSHVSIGRFSTLAAKHGKISLADGVNVGSYCRIATQSNLEIDKSTLIAAYCYIGPGNHQSGDSSIPLIAREMEQRGGVKIGANCWLGSHVTVLDGVTVGAESIIGAHSLVKDDIPPRSIAFGVPAKVVRTL